MQEYQREFIRFAIEQEVLLFGEFITKSGRKSPYFYNSGGFSDGKGMAKLGKFYAAALEHSEVVVDFLYGPAYKGIPLVIAMSTAMYQCYARVIPWCFNRKEEKDHGEGGIFVGANPEGKALIVDDVITSGVSVEQSCTMLQMAGASPRAAIVAVDREECGHGRQSAITEIEQKQDISVLSIVTLTDIIKYMENEPALVANQHAIMAYREQYCVAIGD